ncbi:5887_t:CDS:2 [Paraglomus occultum]|uniref:5887_t:CDS:1 n=1 Tax=Paraglomus occultum TaxID=144539 RepID=A0A9N8ZNM4_9GLOM|nr:5887_t:CDS:2 [Paraglomus occultum]
MRATTAARKAFTNIRVKMPFTLWVKYRDYQPVSLEFETGNVNQLKNAVKRELTPDLNQVNNNIITLRKHKSTVDLGPDVIVDESFSKTAKTPLQVSARKTFFVQSYDYGGYLMLGKFEKYTMLNDKEFDSFLKRIKAYGLKLMSGVSEEYVTSVDSFYEIIPGEVYELITDYLHRIEKEFIRLKVEDKTLKNCCFSE